MSNEDKKIRLKKDIIIPAGTIMRTAPVKTARCGDFHFDCVVGLTDSSHGFFNYCVDDEKLYHWFEEVD